MLVGPRRDEARAKVEELATLADLMLADIAGAVALQKKVSERWLTSSDTFDADAVLTLVPFIAARVELIIAAGRNPTEEEERAWKLVAASRPASG